MKMDFIDESQRALGLSPNAALHKLYGGFSYPQTQYISALDELVPVVVREYAAALTATYLNRVANELDANSDGLVAYLAGWISDPVEFSKLSDTQPPLGWDYAFGDVYRTLHNVGGDPLGVMSAVALQLASRVWPGEWEVKFNQPHRLRWGRWLLPPAERLRVQVNASSARLDYASATASGVLDLNLVDGHWQPNASNPVTLNSDIIELACIDEHDVRFALYTRDALLMRDYEDLLERSRTTIDPRMFDVFGEALNIIAEYTPQYLRWVARTVHQLFLIAPRPGKVESGSVEHYLGLIHLTEHFEPLPVAELLVHEATHQYMNVVNKLQPLDDGSDQNFYWSPAVNKDRPISKIIAAFHAFGNVLLFYRCCRESGLANRRECNRQEALLGSWMEHFVPPIVNNPAITPTGNGLCEPLLAALDYA